MSLKEKLLKEDMGFVTSGEIEALVKEDRFMRILVRCGCGRFIVPAQDAQHFIDIVEASNSDYVRDASIYTGN